jgi:hypothetical protein
MMGEKSRSGTGTNIPDHISESLEKFVGLKILKFFDVDPDPGSGIFLTLDPGWKIRIRIQVKGQCHEIFCFRFFS